MPLAALALVITAGALHAAWNLLLKQAHDTQVFTGLAVIVGALAAAPLFAVGGPVPREIWIYAAASAFAEAVYFYTLSRAYRHGDFSVVYPIARGTAPALLALWAALLLGDRPSPAGLAGLLLVVLGLMIVGATTWWQRRRSVVVRPSGIRLALAVAMAISVYSVIDAAAVRHVAPTAYMALITALTALFFLPLLALLGGYRAVAIEWRLRWRSICVVGVLMMLSYLIVLQAYAIARAGYVGAVREISIIFAALIGWRRLGEAFGMARTLGAAFIFAGIVLIAALG